MTEAAKVETYRRAAEQGDLEAQFNLACSYANGRGVAQDDGQAMLWYRKAADRGHTGAQNNIGWMHDNGRGVAKDPDEAIRWYRKAADSGNAFAQNNLGIKYENGTGVKKDLVEAARWYRLAAAQGNAQAKESLTRVEGLIATVPKSKAPPPVPQRDAAPPPIPQRNVAPPPVVERRAKEPGVPAAGHEQRECKHLLDACTPLIYRHNSFRITGLIVDSSARDIKKRIEEIKNAEELGSADEEHSHAFALKPSPAIEHIREAAQRLQDPERRIVDEFFWFWPTEWGSGKRDPALTALANGDKDTAFKLWSDALATNHSAGSLVAKHNLAVFYHLVALDSEHVAMDNDLAEEQLATVSKYWRTSFQWWEELTDDETFWSLVTDRIRMLDDPRLTTGFARRMRHTLPEAMDKINAMVAISFIERDKHALAEKHIGYMVETHAGQDNVQKTMALVAKPLFARIRSTLAQAEQALSGDGDGADGAALNVLNIAGPTLGILTRFLPKNHSELIDVGDAVVDVCLRCQQVYLRNSKKWKNKWDVAIGILDRAKDVAVSKHSREAIREAREEAERGRDLAHPKIKELQELLVRIVSEDLADKLKTFGSEVAQALHAVGEDVGTQTRSYELAADLVAGAMRGLSVDLINHGQERVTKVLKFFEDEQNRIRHQVALRMNLPQAIQLEQNKWDAIIEVAVGIELYDKGRQLARSAELKKRFADDAEALDGVRQFCSQITELDAKRRERNLVLHWWRPRSQGAAQPPPVPRQGSSGTTTSSGGCFVATAVYGSYEHPAVFVLRRYRDECLAGSRAGRTFIRIYYKVGPVLATLVAQCECMKGFCRGILDQVVCRIAQRLQHEGKGRIKDECHE